MTTDSTAHSTCGVIKYTYSHSMMLTDYDPQSGVCQYIHSDDSKDNILTRMDRLRAMARLQRVKGLKADRLQTSFCF